MPKKRADNLRQLLELSQATDYHGFKFVWPRYRLSACSMGFYVIPDLLCRIQLRRVRWQEINLQAPIERFNAIFHFFGSVSRVTIPNHKRRAFVVMHELFQKLAHLFTVYCALTGHKAHAFSRINGCNHIDAESGTCALHHRRLPLWRPCFAGMIIRSDTGFISKVNLRAKLFGPFFDLWKNFVLPFGNGLRVLLIGTVQGLLWGKAQLTQKPADRAEAQLD